MSIFAKHTQVAVAQTRGDIQAVLGKYGGTPFQEFVGANGDAVILFDARGYHLRFNLPLPIGWQHWVHAGYGHNNATAQETRTRWRVLHLCIKAKLEAIESHVESFEAAFFYHIVDPNSNLTMGEKLLKELPAPERKQVDCPHCGAKNNILIGTDLAKLSCGRCHKPLRSKGDGTVVRG